MVAGGPRSGERYYTAPESLEAELEEEFGYSVHPDNVITSNEDTAGVEATLNLIQTRFDATAYLLEEYGLDFLHLTIFHLNVLQHYFYEDDPTRRAWKIIDENLGQFLDEGHTIFLMSDHGCGPIGTVFNINEWLQQEGYLSMRLSSADYLMKFGVTQARLASLVRRLGLKATLRKHLPRRFIERVPDEEGIKRDN